VAHDVSQGHRNLSKKTTVHQFGPWVWGTIEYPDKKYEFRGKLRENILVARYEIIRRPSVIDVGAFTLVLNPERNELTGKYAWTDDELLTPKSDNYQWTKVDHYEWTKDELAGEPS
jgi:hypothetical protein